MKRFQLRRDIPMWRIFLLTTGLLLSACQSAPSLPPLPTAGNVDLPRFMGDWYVIANIPTFPERDAWNAMESYRLRADGRIATTFTYNKGGYDGPRKTLTPMGFVRDGKSNAVWGMQFVWPMQAEYVITWLDDDYSQTIIARNKRDYVWVLARTPTISVADYNALTERIHILGYDLAKLRPVPQQVPPFTGEERP
jgi:apolipoprotein D and lipocalin family protein